MAKGSRSGGPWRKRPSTILWMLSLGQLISWGLVYYTFPLFVVPMTQELGWSRTAMFGALSAGLLVAGLASIPVGAWIDRGHGRVLMTGGSLGEHREGGRQVVESDADDLIALVSERAEVGILAKPGAPLTR